jgi:acyl dehydratase
MKDLSGLIGQELGVGEWMEISQDRVDAFASATNDHQWIHEAGERAVNGPFGGPIAHGFLTLSLLTPLTGEVLRPLAEGAVMAINYGLDKVRFITPVRVGSRIRARVKLAEVKPIENGVQLKTETTIEIDGSERPAAAVESLVRLYG